MCVSVQALKFPNAVVSAVVACKNGIKRTHIIDARIDGGLLLELYSRDGVGTMISTDFYEGIRGAQASDLENILVFCRRASRLISAHDHL